MQINVQFTKSFKVFWLLQTTIMYFFFENILFWKRGAHTIKREKVTLHRSCLHLEQKPVGAIVKEVR